MSEGQSKATARLKESPSSGGGASDSESVENSMLYGQIPGVTKPVARLIQGSVMVRSDAQEASFRLLDDILALGGNTFDLAHVYGEGDVERTFGRWLEARGVRDRVVVITKGAHHNRDRQRVTPFDITADLFDSLARLRIDAIDLYLLHRDDPTVPVGPIVEVLNEHQAAGRIHAFGGSNWRHERIAAANEYAAAHGLTPFVVSSPHLSLAVQFQPPWPNCVTLMRWWVAPAAANLLPTSPPAK